MCKFKVIFECLGTRVKVIKSTAVMASHVVCIASNISTGTQN